MFKLQDVAKGPKISGCKQDKSCHGQVDHGLAAVQESRRDRGDRGAGPGSGSGFGGGGTVRKMGGDRMVTVEVYGQIDGF
jgi:hypothetical protein